MCRVCGHARKNQNKRRSDDLTSTRLSAPEPYTMSLHEAIWEQWKEGTPKPNAVVLPAPKDDDERAQLERFLVYYPRAAAAGELYPFDFIVAHS